jgi:hypothetical protein
MKQDWNMTWKQMNDLETLTNETKAMLEVVSDGLLNDICSSNPENSAVVIRMAVERIESMESIHEEMWDVQREARFADTLADERDNEDADSDEDFDTKDLFSDLPITVDETNIDPKQMSEAVYEAQKAREEELTGSFNVKELKRNEDGSVTYEISGSDETMQELFEAFFMHALINGIKYTKEDNDKEVSKLESLKVARELEVLLREWEISDEFDYDPVVKNKRLKLRELLDKAGV